MDADRPGAALTRPGWAQARRPRLCGLGQRLQPHLANRPRPTPAHVWDRSQPVPRSGLHSGDWSLRFPLHRRRITRSACRRTHVPIPSCSPVKCARAIHEGAQFVRVCSKLVERPKALREEHCAIPVYCHFPPGGSLQLILNTPNSFSFSPLFLRVSSCPFV